MDVLKDIKLSILVFGPTPNGSPAGFTADLAKKRVEIRDALVGDGHSAVFPEDLMSGAPDPHLNNAYLFEESLVREYDMVVNLVGSYGSTCELGLFTRDHLALKAALYFNRDHATSLAYHKAVVLKNLGASLETYIYPDDLSKCNLMKHVRDKVYAVRIGKFYSS
jgi:hypothetical protein